MEDRLTPSDSKMQSSLDGDLNTPHVSDNPKNILQEFEQLFHQYYSYLCSTANAILHDPILAEDIVQEFYIEIWNNQKPMPEPKAFRAYAKRAVTNDSIDYLRKQKVIGRNNSLLDIQEDFDPNAEAEQQEQTSNKHQRILDLVAELPESRKQIVMLHAVDKLSYAQIAEKQEISINTVRTQLSRAYKSLRTQASLILMSIFRKL